MVRSEEVDRFSQLVQELSTREVLDTYEVSDQDSWEWKFGERKWLRVTEEFLMSRTDHRGRLKDALALLNGPKVIRVIVLTTGTQVEAHC